MKPHHNQFHAAVLDLDDNILFLFNQDRLDLLGDSPWLNLALTKTIGKVTFSPLCLPRHNYSMPQHIITARIDLANTCLLQYRGYQSA